MLGRVIRKEILSHVLSLRFTVAFILLLLLVFAGVYVSIHEYRQNMDEYMGHVRVHQKELNDILKEKDDWDRFDKLFWDIGRSDAVPVSPLSWLGQGLQPSYPASINVRANGQTRAIRFGLMRNPLRGLMRIPDFVYVVSVVLSFLAILFTFDAVCGEKEDGTLRLMLSNAVPRHEVLLGKWIGGGLVVLVPFLLASAGVIGFATALGVMRPEDIGGAVLVVAIACLYVMVFLNIGLFISTVTVRSATALLTCLLVWVLFILVIPNMAPVTARILEPTPPLETIRAEKRAVDQEINLRISRLTLTSGELSYGQHIQEERQKLDNERKRRQDQWDKYYSDSLVRQMDLAQALGRISPAACWTYAALSLTGTGPGDHALLKEAQTSLAASFDRLMKQTRAKANPGGEDKEGWSKLSSDEVPGLHKKSLSMGVMLNQSLNDMLVLAVLGVLFFMLAFMRFLRYDVR